MLSCAAVSTPSATERRSSWFDRSTTASTIASSNGSESEPGDERPVDLHRVDRELLEEHQRRVARPEVVERELDAELVQLVEEPPGRVQVSEEELLGDLEGEQRRVEVGIQDGLGDGRGEVRVGELGRRDVDAGDEPTPFRVLVVPPGGGATHLGPDPLPDRAHEPGLLGHAEELGGGQQPACRVVPAQQRFETGHGARLE